MGRRSTARAGHDPNGRPAWTEVDFRVHTANEQQFGQVVDWAVLCHVGSVPRVWSSDVISAFAAAQMRVFVDIYPTSSESLIVAISAGSAPARLRAC